MNREFLCDCQLDLEYASILKQISACGEKTHYDLTLRFTVNLAFWQMLKQYKPNLAKTVMPNMKRVEQTFLVKLFENVKGPLQMLTALTDIVKRLDNEGKKSKNTETRNPPIFSRYESNIMTIISGGLASVCAVVILIIIVKQTRLQSLVSSLGLVSLIPPVKALYFTEMPKATNVPYFLARNVPNEKVVCSHPLQRWVAPLPLVVLCMLRIRYLGLCPGTAVTETADVAHCISFSTMMTFTHH